MEGGDGSARKKQEGRPEFDATNTSLRYPRRLLIRMTDEERRVLGKRAHAAYLSLSRYLVQSAMQGKAPPTEAEREQLERLLFLLRRAATILTQVLGNARVLRLTGVDRDMESHLVNAVELMNRLCQALKKRL